MVSRLPVIDEDGEVGDLSRVDPKLFKPFSELPKPLQTKLRGRPRAKQPKEAVKEDSAGCRRSGRTARQRRWLADPYQRYAAGFAGVEWKSEKSPVALNRAKRYGFHSVRSRPCLSQP